MTDKKHNLKKPINRREMLKKGALAAGGAITAAAFLDGKWLKPIVKTGILPVHAQASACGVYTFVPLFDWVWGDGAWASNLGVDITPFGPGGPITYEITSWYACTLDGALSGFGTVASGHATFIGSVILTNPDPPEDVKITIRWTYDGCTYEQEYTELDIPPYGG